MGTTTNAATLPATGAASGGSSAPVAVATSRALTNADNGQVLDCASGITLTVPDGLDSTFACALMLSASTGGSVSVARSGTALLNGAGTTLTGTASTPALMMIQATATANSYTVVL